jgi:hypothetical protein
MINYIKDAVSAVSGIKTFLFNTDYRNNFDLQNVEFPCCVLTPIMSKKYDLNNIIRESAELQLSVVDLAPYDYTGDDLYAINKRCSDLALQVIANLQVKSKLDKELTFEFILPSGDELISGVMCNLQCTMKQGSCIGAPSYIEVIVQPLKKESITSNGKHIISADSGFNAMREVEVDVNIDELTTEEKVIDITRNGEVEILPTSADAMTKVTANVQVPPPPLEEKQVTITKAKTTEIITPDAEYGLSRVEVSTDIPLESKQVTINENGTTTIEASEGFEGIESVEVTTDVNTLQGLDFSDIYDAEQANGINQYYKDGIEYAKKIKAENPNPSGDWAMKFYNDPKFIFLPHIDMSNITNLTSAFSMTGIVSLFGVTKKVTDLSYICYMCAALRKVILNTDSATTLRNAFGYCATLEHVELTSITGVKDTTYLFNLCYNLINLRFTGWAKNDISLVQSSKLSAESIDYILENAVDVVDGATDRALQLHATAGANWDANSKYQGEERNLILTQKGIEVTW